MKQVFTVSQINSYVRRIFDGDYALRKIFLKGEVSNCKYHPSGHIYFTLKDEKSALRCIMFSAERQKGLLFPMENGQMVTVMGNISVFERDGVYQLYAKEIELSGEGEQYVRYEKLKRELAEKGYFDFERKKPLPSFPERIGIVTAVSGAAVEDIKSVAARRNPFVQLYLFPAKVQGEGAAETIAAGIRFFDRQDVDVIIIGRGGGSMEDLWAFNDPAVADSIFEAETPVISGTGHEIDMTIADYCADVRAATPSAACEIAIPDIFSVIQQKEHYKESLESRIIEKTQEYRRKLTTARRLLEARHPKTKLMRQKMRYQYLKQRIYQAANDRMKEARHRLRLQAERMHALSPTARLSGGYVFAQDKKGRPVSSVSQLSLGTPFSLTFSDGNAEVIPTAVTQENAKREKNDSGEGE